MNCTVAANAARWGTGGINVDACRIPTSDEKVIVNTWDDGSKPFGGGAGHPYTGHVETRGRWPANLIHDGSEEVLAGFPGNAGAFAPVRRGHDGTSNGIYGDFAQKGDDGASFRGDTGSAARFFYCAKASKRDRDEGCEGMKHHTAGECTDRQEGTAGLESPRAGAGRTNGSRNHHPTVKPTDLMRYLCRLVTPPGGIVLDPFMGSGSTGKAAMFEGFRFVGIEKEPEYHEIAVKRIEAAQAQMRFLL